jgi:hypothetical protein
MRLASSLCLFGGLAIVAPLRAQGFGPPLGNELPVNTYTTSLQDSAAIASAGDGTFTIVWASFGQDGSENGIFGERFDVSGAKLGVEFAVNSYTPKNEGRPSIAMNGDGAFVVVWESYDQDGSGSGIFGRRFGSGGGGLGSEFQVNAHTAGRQSGPRVARNSVGDFVVVWTSDDQDGSGGGIFAQRYDGAGGPIGPEFRVNSYTTGNQGSPDVAIAESGAFVVVWESYQQDGDLSGIFGQRFDNSGMKLGPEFPINASSTGSQSQAAIAMDHAANFIVVWSSSGDDPGIFGQRFNAGGEAVGGNLPISTTTTGHPDGPSIATEKNGGFSVVWESGGSDRDVFGQRFDRSGNKLGTEFAVNTVTTGDQLDPRVAFDGLGIVAAWTTSDGDESGVARRRQNLVPDSLEVDAHSTSGTFSDLDGVLEPGEIAAVEPVWRNVGGGAISLTGTATNFTGPAGGAYTLVDGTADYGSIGPGTTQDCRNGSASHDCYVFGVNAVSRPATHWDAKFREHASTNGGEPWLLHVGDSFADVPRSEPFYAKIETLLHAGITSGCTATTYCPGSSVSRGAMAIFVAKGMAGPGENVPAAGVVNAQSYDCSPGGHSVFTDVLPTDLFCKHVHYLAVQNVTLGCLPDQYCPAGNITRDAMASFIAKAIVAPAGGAAVPTTYTDLGTGRSYSCDAGTPNVHFTDVPASSPFCKHVHYLWAKNVVSGCGATTYCPGGTVNRDAMAKFLANGFGLKLYGP